MKKRTITNVLFLGLVALGATTTEQDSRPNVILVYADDVGYGDLGAYGAELIKTPNLDRLAANGLLFTDAYATHSVCTPSRYSLLTGRYAWRKDLNILPGNAGLSIDPERYTMADLFKGAGYRTGIVGKWHLGLGAGGDIDWNGLIQPGPNELGFDYSFLIPSTGDRVPCVYVENGQVVGLDPDDPITVSYGEPLPGSEYLVGREQPAAKSYVDSDNQHSDTVINGIGRIGFMKGGTAALWDDETMADRLVSEGKDFIEKAGNQPFFLFFSTHDIHDPHVPHPRFKGESSAGDRGDAMVQLDATVGALIGFLEKKGLTDSTMLIFTSDNGPIFADGYFDDDLKYYGKHAAAGPFRGGKYSTMEGGTRVPFILSWPDRVQPGTSQAVLSQVDLMASFAAFLDKDLPSGAAPDSLNILGVLLGTDPSGNPEIFQCDIRGNIAIRCGDWKYFPKGFDSRARKPYGDIIEFGEALFRVTGNGPEGENLIRKHPEKALELKARLKGRAEDALDL